MAMTTTTILAPEITTPEVENRIETTPGKAGEMLMIEIESTSNQAIKQTIPETEETRMLENHLQNRKAGVSPTPGK